MAGVGGGGGTWVIPAGMEDPRQKKLLAEASRRLLEKASTMRQSAERSDVQGTIDRATDILRELRTSKMTPKCYYELYMKVLDELSFLQQYFMGIRGAGMSLVALYQVVQSCTQVLPRLYLMMTVGACCLRTGQVPMQEILSDLVELAKGVQDPMKGLFLRNYLNHVTRNDLPGGESSPSLLVSTEVSDETLSHAIDFLLENFYEANRLWVRMHQQQGASRDKKQREQERKELRLLVGTNLIRLSQLDGVTPHTYRESILPRFLEQVVDCRDTIAQSYLMDCAIQVFPDEFHIYALDVFLDGLCKLKEKVKVRFILQALVRRLGRYLQSQPQNSVRDDAIVVSLNQSVKRLVDERKNLQVGDIFLMEADLVEFMGKSFPGRLDHLNHCLLVSETALAARLDQLQGLTQSGADALQTLLSTTVSVIGCQAIGLEKFLPLLDCLAPVAQVPVALDVVGSFLTTGTRIQSQLQVEYTFRALSSLWYADGATDPSSSSKIEGLELVGQVIHLIGNSQEGPAADFQLYLAARDSMRECSDESVEYTLPPLVFAVLRVISLSVHESHKEAAAAAAAAAAERSGDDVDVSGLQALDESRDETPDPVSKSEPEAEAESCSVEAKENSNMSDNGELKEDASICEADGESSESKQKAISAPPQPEISSNPRARMSVRKGFQFLHETVTSVAPQAPFLSLRLFLECAIGADRAGLSAISYEFVSQAFILFEDEISDSKDQYRSILSMVGALSSCQSFDPEDYDALVTKVTQYASRLTKKQDQSKMVMLCSHLFWNPKNETSKDDVRVLECLQRSLKLADACMSSSGPQSIYLFLEVLNCYVYFAETGNEKVAERYISGLNTLIEDHVHHMDLMDSQAKVEALSVLRSTMDHYQSLQSSGAISLSCVDDGPTVNE